MRLNVVQRGDHVVEDVGLERRGSAGRAEELAAEIVERVPAIAFAADDGVRLQPDEHALGIVIEAAAERSPLARSVAERLDGDGGVGERTPFASGFVVEAGGGVGEAVAELLGSPQAAARGEHVAEITGQTFVNPQQFALHRLLVIRRGKARGAAVLAVPRVDEFVRQQAGGELAKIGIDKRAQRHAIVAGLVVLEAAAAGHVGERNQEVIAAVVMRAEERSGFRHQTFVAVDEILRQIERGVGVGGDVEFLRRRTGRRKRNHAIVRTGDDGRIDERGQRNWREFDSVSGLAHHRQRSSEFPVWRKLERCLEGVIGGRLARGIERYQVPVEDHQLVGGSGIEAAGAAAGRDVVEADLHAVGARGHVAVEGVHVDVVAMPRDGLAGGLEAQLNHIIDGPGGAMIAGEPLRVVEGERAGRGGNGETRMKDAARGLARVDVELDGLSGGEDSEKEEEEEFPHIEFRANPEW